MKRFRFLISLLLTASLWASSPAFFGPWRGSGSGAGCAAAAPAAGTAKAEGEPATADNAYLPTVEELKLGREGAAEAEKEYKIVKDGDPVKRVQAIGSEVVRAALDAAMIRLYLAQTRPPKGHDTARRAAFAFSFKLAQSKEVNAFSFAGGPVYITTGLLDYVHSDHELAAVLAHEVAHVTHHHLAQLIRRQSKAEQKLMWALLASLLTGAANSPDFGNVMAGAQLYMIAKQYGYGRDAERDADKTGVEILRHTRYNPVGMLTVMKRFAADEARRGGPEMGIYQSHPYARERAGLISGYLLANGIKVEPGMEREVSNAFRTETRETTAGARPVADLSLNGDLMFRAAVGEGKSPMERARAIEQRLTQLLEQGLSLRGLRLSDDGTQLLADGQPLLTVYPADAEAAGMSVRQASKRALDVLLKALWKEQLDLTF